MDEHEIQPDKIATLGSISKLGPQWKVFHDFQPTCFSRDETPHLAFFISCRVGPASTVGLAIACTGSRILLLQCTAGKAGPAGAAPDTQLVNQIESSSALPKIGEWTRIGISHEEVDGKFYVALSKDDIQLGRKEAHPELRRMTDFEVGFGGAGAITQRGFLRRVALLDS